MRKQSFFLMTLVLVSSGAWADSMEQLLFEASTVKKEYLKFWGAGEKEPFKVASTADFRKAARALGGVDDSLVVFLKPECFQRSLNTSLFAEGAQSVELALKANKEPPNSGTCEQTLARVYAYNNRLGLPVHVVKLPHGNDVLCASSADGCLLLADPSMNLSRVKLTTLKKSIQPAMKYRIMDKGPAPSGKYLEEPPAPPSIEPMKKTCRLSDGHC